MPSVEWVWKSDRPNRGMTPSHGSVPPPTPTPILGTTPSRPANTRGSDHMILPALASLLGRSRAGSSRLPASSTATEKPRDASSLATREPQAPAPTITASAEEMLMSVVQVYAEISYGDDPLEASN